MRHNLFLNVTSLLHLLIKMRLFYPSPTEKNLEFLRAMY
jgi:hypothetical protein